jgi:hypothetical protein
MIFTSLSLTEPDSESGQPKPGWFGKISQLAARHPVLTVFLAALLAVTINCYPLIFCDRSLVSSGCFHPLVYDSSPTLPGSSSALAFSQHGSDSAAAMLWSVPAGFIASRSLLQDGELPLWNRYGHAGEPFLGQAISMVGDPLHLIVIFGQGAAGAWDIKFLAAKFLFSAGFGLLILRLLGRVPLAMLFSALAAYCGAFYFIDNHPVFFSFSYSPWVLLCAMAMLDLRGKHRLGWGLLWLTANVACFNGGHVEVGVVLIAGLNLAALVWALSRCRSVAQLTAVLTRIGMGTVLFLGLTAPV